MRFGPNISASILYGASWILLCAAVLMAVLAGLTSLGFVTLPISVRTDLIGAAICALLALVFRFAARRFERVAYLP